MNHNELNIENRNPVLKVEGLCLGLGQPQRLLLDQVSFSLMPGKIFALIGESGSGKSLTALSLMRLLPYGIKITQGSIRLEDIALLKLSEQQMQQVRGRRLAMIFQNALSCLNPIHRVGFQIAEALKCHAHNTNYTGAIANDIVSDNLPNKAALTAQVITLLEEVGIENTANFIDRYPHQLSGGQQQRVAIAMALACKPIVLIADEPTTALDTTIQQQILLLLQKLAQTRQLAVLLITHDMGVVYQVADTIAVIYQGRIIEHGSKKDLLAHPQADYTKMLINERVVTHHYLKPKNTGLVLRVAQLEVSYKKRSLWVHRAHQTSKALNQVSLSIAEGETLALVGESGSGKTTLGRAILRLVPLAGGEIWFGAQRLDQLNPKAMRPFRKAIQIIFQNPFASMNPRMRIADIMSEGFISLNAIKNPDAIKERVLYLLETVQLNADFYDRYPHQCSGGQLQRIAIARALAVEPKLIICDEPTSALDVAIRGQIVALLKKLQAQFHLSYLLITHDLSLVPQLAHRVAVLQQGQLVEIGTAEAVFSRPQAAHTRALLAARPIIK